MQMKYNMDFLISALALLILIFGHFISDRKINTHRNRVFLAYMLLGMADIFMDILTSLLISAGSPGLRNATVLLTTVFYVLQIIVPAGFVYYVQSMRDAERSAMKRFMTICAVPTAAMLIVILTNSLTGALFSVSYSGVYAYGPYNRLMYVYSLFCMAVTVIMTLLHRKEFTKKQIVIIFELVFITMICVLIQMKFRNIAITGVAIALIITVLLFTLHNPYSCTDNLTGLYDMQFFRDYIRHEASKEKHYHIISIYFSNMNYINSALGAERCEELLINTADRLRAVSSSEYVFRLDEGRFAVAASTLKDYEYVINDISKYAKESDAHSASEASASMTVCGVIDAERLETSGNIISYIEYLEGVTTASGGFNIIQGDTDTMHGFRYNQEIEQFLKTAVEQDLFEINFQPMYSIDDDRFISMEALSRLRHPSLGPVPPDVFIQIAERSGDIEEIGCLQFRRVCSFVKENRSKLYGIRNVKVNLSPAEFLTPGHGGVLRSIMDEYGIEPSFFQFEITETAATQYSDNLMQALADFRKAGIGLCMDDFGSGYANLNSVMRIPFSTIKLDRSLLTGSKENEKIRIFYMSIASILSDMGFYVVAEGVETEEELAFIRQCRVNCVQGYYFSKPLGCDEVVSLLENNVAKDKGSNQ